MSLRIEENDFVAITGPSGSGKSTLMHILGCLDVPTSGIFRLAGHDAQSFDEDQLADVRNLFIGFVFQQFNLLAYLPAWRNVELPLIYSGRRTRPSGGERALVALDKVGLADRADHKPGELSGGQQQRVAIARALVTEPAMILADEPTGNLDSTSTAEVLDLLEELNREGRTIVLITHEHDIAQRARSASIQIRDGRVWRPDDAAPGRARRGDAVSWRDTFRTATEAVRTHRLRSALDDARDPDRHHRGRADRRPRPGRQGAGAGPDQRARHQPARDLAGQHDRAASGARGGFGSASTLTVQDADALAVEGRRAGHPGGRRRPRRRRCRSSTARPTGRRRSPARRRAGRRCARAA